VLGSAREAGVTILWTTAGSTGLAVDLGNVPGGRRRALKDEDGNIFAFLLSHHD